MKYAAVVDDADAMVLSRSLGQWAEKHYCMQRLMMKLWLHDGYNG